MSAGRRSCAGGTSSGRAAGPLPCSRAPAERRAQRLGTGDNVSGRSIYSSAAGQRALRRDAYTRPPRNEKKQVFHAFCAALLARAPHTCRRCEPLISKIALKKLAPPPFWSEARDSLNKSGRPKVLCALLLWTMICQRFRSRALWGGPRAVPSGRREGMFPGRYSQMFGLGERLGCILNLGHTFDATEAYL